MGNMLIQHFSLTHYVLSNKILDSGSPYVGQSVYYKGW